MSRFEVRERVTFDVVDTEDRDDSGAAFRYEDGKIMQNVNTLVEAEQLAAEHEAAV